ncbi:hypothetical protein M8J75_009638 [Diaphorina citri]|nr:hypothetical protein M8J75_009638 [Diaphorina citri]
MYDTENDRTTFLEKTKAARLEREHAKKKEDSIILIQSHARKWLAKRNIRQQILKEFDELIHENTELKCCKQIYQLAKKFLWIWNKEEDKTRFEYLCRYINASLDSKSPSLSYIGVFLIKEHTQTWIAHIKNILWKCCLYLSDSKIDSADMKNVLVLLHTLVSFTSTNTWSLLKNNNAILISLDQLCHNFMGHLYSKGFYSVLKDILMKGLMRSKITLKNVALSGVITLATRPLISSGLSDKLIHNFLTHILCCLKQFENEEVLKRCLEVLSNQEEAQHIFNKLEGNYVLCMIGNLIHLSYLQLNSHMKEVKFPLYTVVLTRLLSMLQEYVSNKQSNLTTWHPILGWFAQTYDPKLTESLPLVKSQLFLLWSDLMVDSLLTDPLQVVLKSADESAGTVVPSSQPTGSSNIIKRTFFESRSSRSSANKAAKIKLGSSEVSRVTVTCSLYYSAITTFTQLKLDILTGLCYRDSILSQLWKFFVSLGPMCGMKSLLELFSVNPKAMSPEFNTLILFCDLMTHYIIILDDIEMYESQECFSLSDYEQLSLFLNHFLYKCIVNGLFDQKMSGAVSNLFHSAHTLLMLLYRRDSRRKFTKSPTHWIIKDCKVNSFMGDLDRGKKSTQLLLQKIPHIVSHEERVRLFRKYVANEKSVLGLTESACAASNSTLIVIHRKRLLEDGYRQLAKIPPHSLKGIVRVRFINVQGLDEAGIDQDGVFKEFLEETIKWLNLFKVTSEERLYPSPTSYLHDSHLQLFEFVGRMLGKAVYEGIVVDVPFASFFLSQVLGYTSQALYSCMDELPSLDTDLYRSLTYVKHYPGDVTDLDLTFSVDEDVMGRLVTHELTPGGKVIPVTNQNKINYIHLMAHFRMHTQIKHQTTAFIKGFKSIINPEWLSLFSTPELQRLISGDNSPLDLTDLRRYTVYYGGFHDSHKVVLWLWDILNKDFNEEERKLFLKFVTSCSKPPLLGFAHLEPPFSIRCVEVTDDEDTGDTIGSVIRGFFTIRKKDPQHRLPTASTCFNLLKLPNYQRKSTLRDKLRYAITSNTGFELS